MAVLTDPADCGPVTLAFCQDVQAEAFDYPESFFERAAVDAAPRAARRARARRRRSAALRAAKKPLIIAGGGVLYSEADGGAGGASPSAHGIPVAETQAGKSRAALPTIRSTWARSASPAPAPPTRWPREADVVLAVGTRLQDFTTGSLGAVQEPRTGDHRRSTSQPFDAAKHGALPLVADAGVGLEALDPRLGDWQAPARLDDEARRTAQGRLERRPPTRATAPTNAALPSDAQVIGAVQRARPRDATSWSAPPAACRASCTSCGRPARPAATTSNTAISCMGYEIAGGLGVKMAAARRAR